MYVVRGVLWLARGVFWKGLGHFAPLWLIQFSLYMVGFQLRVRGALICRVLWPSGWKHGWR